MKFAKLAYVYIAFTLLLIGGPGHCGTDVPNRPNGKTTVVPYHSGQGDEDAADPLAKSFYQCLKDLKELDTLVYGARAQGHFLKTSEGLIKSKSPFKEIDFEKFQLPPSDKFKLRAAEKPGAIIPVGDKYYLLFNSGLLAGSKPDKSGYIWKQSLIKDYQNPKLTHTDLLRTLEDQNAEEARKALLEDFRNDVASKHISPFLDDLLRNEASIRSALTKKKEGPSYSYAKILSQIESEGSCPVFFTRPQSKATFSKAIKDLKGINGIERVSAAVAAGQEEVRRVFKKVIDPINPLKRQQ